MDIPIANLMMGGLLTGYERQAKKEEKEAKAIIAGIDPVLLRALCTRYDNKTGEYPEHAHEGAAVLEFYALLKKEVKNMKKQDEKLVDSRLKEMGIKPNIYHFEIPVYPFRAITIADTQRSWNAVRRMINHILYTSIASIDHEKSTLMMKELHARRIYGVAICEHRDQFNRQRGRTIAKGRLLEFLRAVKRTEERKNEIEKEKERERK